MKEVMALEVIDDFKVQFGEKGESDEEGLLSGSNYTYSPNGQYLAASIKHRILIRNAKTLRLDFTYPVTGVVGSVDKLEWSADSLYLAAVCKAQGVICVRRISQPDWKCRLDLGGQRGLCAGLQDFCWSPDARHLLTTSLFYTQLTVWSLTQNMVTSFRNIRPIPKYKTFNSNGSLLAIAYFDEEYKTCISIYESSEWDLTQRFVVSTKDMEGVEWSPNDSCIVLWDSPLFSNVYIYSPSGQLLQHYSPDGLSVGLQSIQWSPIGHLLATTNHRNMLRILNGLTFGIILEEQMEFSLTQRNTHPDCKVYYEMLTRTGRGIIHQYEIDTSWTWTTGTDTSSPFVLDSPSTTSKMERSEFIKFSSNGAYIACTTEENPNRLWIWNLEKFTLTAVLVHKNIISDFQWDPKYPRLTLCTGNNIIYFWTPEKCYTKSIKHANSEDQLSFEAKRISWNPNGSSFAVQDSLAGSTDRIIIGFVDSNRSRSK